MRLKKSMKMNELIKGIITNDIIYGKTIDDEDENLTVAEWIWRYKEQDATDFLVYGVSFIYVFEVNDRKCGVLKIPVHPCCHTAKRTSMQIDTE